MLQPNDGNERVDGVQVGELHPTPAHAAGHPTVADCLSRGTRQAVGLGTLARGGVEIGRPVPGRLMIDGDHDVVYCKRRVTERKRPASSRRAIATPGTAMRPSRLMLSLITSAPRPNQRTLGSTS